MLMLDFAKLVYALNMRLYSVHTERRLGVRVRKWWGEG